MYDDLGSRLFTFAVITDTHLNQGEDDCNSPFEVNRLANARMRYVVRDLNSRDLAFGGSGCSVGNPSGEERSVRCYSAAGLRYDADHA